MSKDLIVVLSGLFIVVNLLAYLAFAADKHRAIRNEWRISEANLLILALLGGWIGAKLGQRLLRHKTRKQPFGFFLNLTLVLQIGVAIVLVFPDIRSAINERLLGPFTQIEQPSTPTVLRHD